MNKQVLRILEKVRFLAHTHTHTKKKKKQSKFSSNLKKVSATPKGLGALRVVITTIRLALKGLMPTGGILCYLPASECFPWVSLSDHHVLKICIRGW